jgi:hypothetical protein
MGNAPPQLAALALFAEINARIDAGESRIAVLNEKGLSEVEFQQEQEHWLSLMAAQAQQQQWQIQQRYSALYAQWRLKDDSEHTPPMPFVVGPLLSPVARPLSNDLESAAAQVQRPSPIHSYDGARVRQREIPGDFAPTPIHSPSPDQSAFGSPFPLASASGSPQQQVEPLVGTTPSFTISQPTPYRENSPIAQPNVARAPLFVSERTAPSAQQTNDYAPAQYVTSSPLHVSLGAETHPARHVPAASVQTAPSVALSFEQLTCLTAELQVKPDQAEATLAGYGIDDAGYQAQHKELLVRCQADDHLDQRYQRLLEYYRSIVSQR